MMCADNHTADTALRLYNAGTAQHRSSDSYKLYNSILYMSACFLRNRKECDDCVKRVQQGAQGAYSCTTYSCRCSTVYTVYTTLFRLHTVHRNKRRNPFLPGTFTLHIGKNGRSARSACASARAGTRMLILSPHSMHVGFLAPATAGGGAHSQSHVPGFVILQ